MGKGRNDEMVLRLDANVRSGSLFSRKNTAFVSKLGVRVRPSCSGALF